MGTFILINAFAESVRPRMHRLGELARKTYSRGHTKLDQIANKLHFSRVYDANLDVRSCNYR